MEERFVLLYEQIVPSGELNRTKPMTFLGEKMLKKFLMTAALITISFLAFAFVVVHHGSTNHQIQTAGLSQVTSSASVAKTSGGSTPIYANSQPIVPSSTDGSFGGPLGYLSIDFPSNATYASDMLTLEVSGRVMMANNIELTINYSLDGQEPLPIHVEIEPANPGDILIGAVNGSVALPHLSEGSHYITIFGDLEANGSHLTQITVRFVVNPSSP
ncbi:MAG: hypothetical protein ABSE15_04275 [Candidatus Bathyarchaeia archaeon]